MIGATRYASAAEIARQSRLSSDIAKLQTSVSTNKRLAAGSDDPIAAARIGEIGVTQANHTAYEKNIDTGTAVASAADTQLTALQNALTRAKELMINGRTDTTSAADRASIANELDGITAEINSYASATDPNGNPLFPTTPTAIPISDSLSLTATASQADVFQGVSTTAGTQSIAQVLASASAALRSGDATAMTNSISDLDSAQTHTTTAQTDQGLRAARFADTKSTLQSSDTDLSAERVGLEDTDLTYALSEIQSKQLSLQAAQTVFAQSHKSNLFSMLG